MLADHRLGECPEQSKTECAKPNGPDTTDSELLVQVSVSRLRVEEPQIDTDWLLELVVLGAPLLLELAMLICDQGGEVGAAGGYKPPSEVAVMCGNDKSGALISRSTIAIEEGVLEVAGSWCRIDGACILGTSTLSMSTTLFLLVILGRRTFFSLSTASGSSC